MSTIVRPSIDLEAKRTKIQNDIEQMFIDLQKQEQHTDVQEHCVLRNILLVGPSKSGKTTLRRVLSDPRYVSEELTLRSSSDMMPICELNLQPLGSSVILNIVELPENMINIKNNLSMINEECARLDIQDFHMICLCISFDAGIDGSAIRSFKHFINHFNHKQISPNLCLIITRCESKNDVQRQKLCNELMQDVEFANIKQYFGRGIHFSGALNRDSWNGASEALYSQFETIYDYRKNLLQLIAKHIEPFHIPSSLSQTEAHLAVFLPGNDETDSLQTASESSEPSSSVKTVLRPLISPSTSQVVRSEPQSIVRPTIPSQTHQQNQPLKQATATTSLLPNRKQSKCSSFLSWLRAYVFSSSHATTSSQSHTTTSE